jgi:DNA polymerase
MCSADPRLNQIVQAVRQYRKSNVNVGKIQAILDRTRPDGMMPMDLIFCGARHTRRWVSRGVNVHNLAREAYELDADDEENYVWTRELLIPREGKKFLIADYSQIEPRCLQWLVGNETLLAAIRSGMNIYEAYGRFSGQWSESGPLNKHTNALLYASMKEQVLGLGYGMGADKYFLTTQKKGLPFTEAECAKSVKDFRARNKGIVSLWYQMDDVIKRAACKDHELSVELPTGEALRYFEVKATQDRSYQGINTRGVRHGNSLQKSLWGGTLTENVVQRMARDVLGDAILRLEKAGLPVIFHAHDEVIAEVDENVDEREAKREIESIMGKEPAWARGLPLGVEAQFATHYLK